jgi:hypothetical protein
MLLVAAGYNAVTFFDNYIINIVNMIINNGRLMKSCFFLYVTTLTEMCNIVTCTFIARQRVGKQADAETNS